MTPTTLAQLPYYISRSATLTLGGCAYKYYLQNVWGRGQRFAPNEQGQWERVTPEDARYPNLPMHPGGVLRATAYRHLSIGSVVHAALEYCLRAALHKQLTTWDECIATAHAVWEQYRKQGWAGESVSEAAWIELEQDYLLQANAHCWLVYHYVVPTLLASYDVLLVEEEETVPLGDNFYFNGRADAVLRPKLNDEFSLAESAGLVCLSFKTVWQWNEDTAASYNIDAQGFTEPWILEHHLRQKYPSFAAEQVASIQFAVTVKGRTAKHPDYLYRYNVGALTHPWRRTADTTSANEEDISAPELTPTGKPKKPRKPKSPQLDAEGNPILEPEWMPSWITPLADGTKKTLSAPKWKRVRASEYPGGQFAYLEYLAREYPHYLSEFWKVPLPLVRSRVARDRYMRAVAARHRVAHAAMVRRAEVDPTLTQPLDQYAETYLFPRTVRPELVCKEYQTHCPYSHHICHRYEGNEPQNLLGLTDVNGRQVFIPRDPHHPEAMEDNLEAED